MQNDSAGTVEYQLNTGRHFVSYDKGITWEKIKPGKSFRPKSERVTFKVIYR